MVLSQWEGIGKFTVADVPIFILPVIYSKMTKPGIYAISKSETRFCKTTDQKFQKIDSQFLHLQPYPVFYKFAGIIENKN